MRITLYVTLAALAMLGGPIGCKKKPTSAEVDQAKEQAERDKAKAQAAKYYQEITEKYPDSEFAAKARERLSAIGPVATPAAKK